MINKPTYRLIAKLALIGAIFTVLNGCDGQSQPGVRTERGGGHGPRESDLALLSPPSTATIKQAQRQLAALGYDPGPIDGILGKKTRIAIKHFQVDQEVAVDGRLTPRLIKLLESTDRERNASYAQAAAGSRTTVAPRALDSVGPRYEVGDTFVYDDGRVETVVRVGSDQTIWETADGSAYTAYRNFILPPISWKTGLSKGENEIRPAGGVKWPPATHDEVVFAVGSRAGGDAIDEPAVWSGAWRCSTGGIEAVETALGKFDAIVIRCDREKPDAGTWKTRIWYFVPEIGHYVRRTESIHGTQRKVMVDLVAVRPGASGWPTAARGGLDWAIQGALDSGDAENPVEWRSSAVGAMFDIRVGGHVPAAGNANCMRYELDRVGDDQTRLFPAIACRKPGQDRWLIPGLDIDAVSPRVLKRSQ